MGFTTAMKRLLEPYSGDGSPYSAMMAFSFLILGKDHEFWREDMSEEMLAREKRQVFVDSINVLIKKDGAHSLLINGGMNSKIYTYKYNKFAYSNIFPQIFDERFTDNSFMFYYKGKGLIRDTIKSIEASHDNIIHMHWGVSNIDGFKAYTTVVPTDYGYLLINNIVSGIAMDFVFCGFNIDANSVITQRYNDTLELKSGDRISAVKSISNAGGKMFARRIPGWEVLNGRSSVLPVFSSKVLPGKNKFIFYVHGSNAQCSVIPDIVAENKKVVVRQSSGLNEMSLKENGRLFYE